MSNPHSASLAFADSQYGYVPQEFVAVLFIALFALSTILHIGQATYYRMWWLLPTACLCGVGELVGWSGRLWSSSSPSLHDPFMMQVVATVISPTPLIAVNFVLLAWIVTLLGPCYARLSPTAYTVLFVSCDVVALLVQAAGGGIASGASTRAGTQLGAHIMLGGIVFQFGKPNSLSMRFGAPDLTTYLQPPSLLRMQITDRRVLDGDTKCMIYALGFSTLVLFVRSIYRIIELGAGWHGRIMRTEVYFNVLDGGMIVLAIFTLNFAHPGRLLGPRRPDPPSEYALKPMNYVGSTERDH
ncbi:RTA1-domain-containing protein [Mycena latifolia]|nr:RTA1-domain-containing protein [Mycena latifolia]